MFKFMSWWDYEKDMLTIQLPNGKQFHYTKEFLEGITALDFVTKAIQPAIKEYHEATQPAKPDYKNALYAALYGSPPKTISDLLNQANQSKGKSALYAAMMQAQQEQLGQAQQGMLGQLGQWHGIGTAEQNQAAHQLGQGSKMAMQQAMQQAIQQTLPPPPVVKELYVYDFGDGMLVPCELAHELASMLGGPTKKPMWGFQKELIEDDLYGVTKAAVKDIADKVDAMIMEKYGPSKVMAVPKEYLTSLNSWFILDDGQAPNTLFASEEGLKEIQKYNMDMQKYNMDAASMQEQVPPKVVIPKKPSKITKESLAHFHKLLGGKKNPYLK